MIRRSIRRCRRASSWSPREPPCRVVTRLVRIRLPVTPFGRGHRPATGEPAVGRRSSMVFGQLERFLPSSGCGIELDGIVERVAAIDGDACAVRPARPEFPGNPGPACLRGSGRGSPRSRSAATYWLTVGGMRLAWYETTPASALGPDDLGPCSPFAAAHGGVGGLPGAWPRQAPGVDNVAERAERRLASTNFRPRPAQAATGSHGHESGPAGGDGPRRHARTAPQPGCPADNEALPPR